MLPASVPFLLLFLIALPATAKSDQCRDEKGPLSGIVGAPHVSSKVCKDSAGRDALRLTFLRVNEAVFGSLIKQEHVPELIPFFGAAALIENAVSAEARDLLQSVRAPTGFSCVGFRFGNHAKPEQATELEWRSFDIRPVSPSGEQSGAYGQ